MITSKPKLIVLDDDEIFASLIVESLGQECDISTGRNGLEGITLALDTRVDLIVTDIGMPELDGIQMLEALSKDPRLSSIPVLVVTATHFSMQNRSDVSRYPQVIGIIHKSMPLDSILQEIRSALKKG